MNWTAAITACLEALENAPNDAQLLLRATAAYYDQSWGEAQGSGSGLMMDQPPVTTAPSNSK